ncbi:hypothetical protein J0J70_02855 [Turicibacter bilis]|uniref:DUF5105 domain-containing protein n=1 Tax=Turicibacter bilis TaxID=2735723 RepID=A0A9Q9CSG1_9FIRM|nr:hypothetical protein [Turicibacter bilis]MBS3198797.1 hypothetical protein [Turicibacter bilis]MBS3200771.1 hypothetical protein [Turicibacter bilis]UUF05580.1 hypothetical protein J0J69_11010 [Turicibacter bilis]UUF08963.1 hypothetical protein J0J70_02855 [Turicibacter bilis]
MEKKVRLISAIIVPAVLFVLFTTTYQNYLPQRNVMQLLDNYKSLHYDSENVAIRLSTDSSVETVLLNKVLPNMNYKILESHVDGDTAIVSLQISNINLDHLLNDYQASLVKQTLKPVQDQNLQSTAQIDDFEISLLVNLIDDPSIKKEYVSQDIELTLHKQDGIWVLEDNEAFFKAVMGYQSDEITFEHLLREVQ